MANSNQDKHDSAITSNLMTEADALNPLFYPFSKPRDKSQNNAVFGRIVWYLK